MLSACSPSSQGLPREQSDHFTQTVPRTGGLQPLRTESPLALFETSWMRLGQTSSAPSIRTLFSPPCLHTALIQQFRCFRLQKLFVGQQRKTGISSLRHPPVPGTQSVQFSLVAQSCLTLCNPMDCSTPDLPVCHQLMEFTQAHVH